MSRARKPIKPPPEIIRPGVRPDGERVTVVLRHGEPESSDGAVKVVCRDGRPAYSGRLRREERLARIPEDWNLPWREIVSIEGGPNWSAAQLLALCCWPRKPEKRHEFAWSLLHAAAREADHSIPGPPAARTIQRRVDTVAERHRKGRRATTIARLALDPLRSPRQAVGRGGKVSVKRLQHLAGRDFRELSSEKLRYVTEGDDDMQRVWREFRPALPQLLALLGCPWIPVPNSDLLAMILQASEWVDQVIAESDEIALDLHQELEIPAEELILCGPAGRNPLRHQST
jgi:hypothetical protein